MSADADPLEYALGVASFHDFALICQSLAQTSSRLQIAGIAGEFLARLDPAEAEIAARLMVGRTVEQGDEKRLQVSGRAIWKTVSEIAGGEERGEDIFAAASDFGEAVEILMRLRGDEPEPSLTIAEVARRLREIAAIEGRNSRRRKLDVLRGLFERATALEGKYLAKILIGEMRHGMSEGLMLEAIAKMADRPIAEIRRAHMLEADLGRVVRKLRLSTPDAPANSVDDDASSAAAVEPKTARRITPMRPMLAAPAPSVAEALRILGESVALEHKLDGARVQVHCDAAEVRIFSRRLNEITPSLPEVVEMAARFGARGAIIDGEVIAIDRSGARLAFQELMRRFGRSRGIDRARTEQPIRLFAFDLMALDGALLIDAPYERRYAALSELVAGSAIQLPDRIVPASLEEGREFYARAIASGHEGVMAKALTSRYTPGARGRGWLKIKHARTLDLVIVAADWGYGRRHGWLSNYHLAARGRNQGEFVEVGKTFKGLTDADFEQMTERLLALKTAESAGTVRVRPEVMVEVAFSDI
ncbi:MAG TPA: ATP-dependent DNA ligase, partial [Candidatus Binataceae bacterium]|nr:ATP-dependent DNA ligase [Candidatus Binataceae bacterium]